MNWSQRLCVSTASWLRRWRRNMQTRRRPPWEADDPPLVGEADRWRVRVHVQDGGWDVRWCLRGVRQGPRDSALTSPTTTNATTMLLLLPSFSTGGDRNQTALGKRRLLCAKQYSSEFVHIRFYEKRAYWHVKPLNKLVLFSTFSHLATHGFSHARLTKQLNCVFFAK